MGVREFTLASKVARALCLGLVLAACQPAVTPVSEAIASPGISSPTPVNVAATVGPPPTPLSPAGLPLGTAVLRGTRIAVELAETPETRVHGLSGRPSLAAGNGLIIGWSKPEPGVRIWMPDMNFAIDVIFVRDGRITAVFADRQPCKSRADCPVFGPDVPTDYVLEVPAGTAASLGAIVGDAIKIER